MVRLQKYISECGFASRRKAEELISNGLVTINGNVAKLGDKVEDGDIVRINNKIIKPEEKKIYIMLNKPTGYLSTVADDRGRKTVVQIIKGVKERVFPVGRLDYDTEGLLILTNDGDFTFKVTHPKHNIKKTYIAKVKGVPRCEELENLKKGIKIEDYVAKADYINIENELNGNASVLITISQGKNRQVRKMFDAIGYPVISLKRIKIGELELGDLKTGSFRFLNQNDLKKTGIL